MGINELERLSNITLRHELKKRNSAFIAVLHFTVTVGSYIMKPEVSVSNMTCITFMYDLIGIKQDKAEPYSFKHFSKCLFD